MVRVLFRLAELQMRRSFRILSVIMGVDLGFMDYGSTILPHPVGIVIHGRAKLGDNVVIYQNVTIASHPRVNEAATIHDGAVLSAGCVIVGPVTIGEGAVIAANAVVTSDVPPFTTVGGIPATRLQRRRFTGGTDE
jgi:serine O-acetyltransferase